MSLQVLSVFSLGLYTIPATVTNSDTIIYPIIISSKGRVKNTTMLMIRLMNPIMRSRNFQLFNFSPPVPILALFLDHSKFRISSCTSCFLLRFQNKSYKDQYNSYRRYC